jgi:hypothetical protein
MYTGSAEAIALACSLEERERRADFQARLAQEHEGPGQP